MTIRSTMIAAAVAVTIGSNMPIAFAATGNIANPTASATTERHAFFFGTLYCMVSGQGNTWLKPYMQFTETPDGAIAHIWNGGCVA